MCAVGQTLWNTDFYAWSLFEIAPGSNTCKVVREEQDSAVGEGWNMMQLQQMSQGPLKWGGRGGLDTPLPLISTSYQVRLVSWGEAGRGTRCSLGVRAGRCQGGTQLWASSSPHFLKEGKWALSSQSGGSLTHYWKAVGKELRYIINGLNEVHCENLKLCIYLCIYRYRYMKLHIHVCVYPWAFFN